MAVKDILGSKEEKKEAAAKHGSGTPVSGYMVSSEAFRCGTCEYLKRPNLCTNNVVQRDSKVKTDKKSGLKLINPVHGCCSYYEPVGEE